MANRLSGATNGKPMGADGLLAVHGMMESAFAASIASAFTTENKMSFDDRELGIITNALRVAAERFREHAAGLDMPMLKDIFEKQAKEADELYNRIANEVGIAN